MLQRTKGLSIIRGGGGVNHSTVGKFAYPSRCSDLFSDNIGPQSSCHSHLINNRTQFLSAARLVLAAIPFCIIVAGALVARPAFAQEEASPRTQIIANDEQGIVTILIDGKAVGMFSKDGLHVTGDLRYGGLLVDVGRHAAQEAIETYTAEDKGATDAK